MDLVAEQTKRESFVWSRLIFFTHKVRDIEVIIQRSEEYGKEIKSKQNRKGYIPEHPE